MTISEHIRQYLSKLGKRGGKRCLETMTPEERSARAKKASSERWRLAKAREEKEKSDSP